jgi:TPR repeat protein
MRRHSSGGSKRRKRINAQAQFHLGWLYELEQGVSQNDVRASMWLNLAGTQEI